MSILLNLLFDYVSNLLILMENSEILIIANFYHVLSALDQTILLLAVSLPIGFLLSIF